MAQREKGPRSMCADSLRIFLFAAAIVLSMLSIVSIVQYRFASNLPAVVTPSVSTSQPETNARFIHRGRRELPSLQPFDVALARRVGLTRDLFSLSANETEPIDSEIVRRLTLVLVSHAPDAERSRFLLTSLHFLDPAGISRLLVVIPRPDEAVFTDLLQDIALPFETTVLPHDVLLHNSEPRNFFDGWKMQMLLKLVVARYIGTEFFALLDSDIVLTGPTAVSDLVDCRGGARCRAIAFEEPAGTHPGFWRGSAMLLQAERCLTAHADPSTLLFSAACQVLSRSLVALTVRRLWDLYGESFIEVLSASQAQWTENVLYGTASAACCADHASVPERDRFEHYHRSVGGGERSYHASGVWVHAQLAAWRADPGQFFGPQRAGHFLTLQEEAGVTLPLLRELVLPFLPSATNNRSGFDGRKPHV